MFYVSVAPQGISGHQPPPWSVSGSGPELRPHLSYYMRQLRERAERGEGEEFKLSITVAFLSSFV